MPANDITIPMTIEIVKIFILYNKYNKCNASVENVMVKGVFIEHDQTQNTAGFMSIVQHATIKPMITEKPLQKK